MALVDLNPGTVDGTVRLVYSQRDVNTNDRSPNGWNREHLWPRSRGIGDSGMDYTDLHHLVPSDWQVNAARGNKFFGDCTTSSDDVCVQPAASEAANDTEMTVLTFLPPFQVRGDIARAMFYMDIRYNGKRNGELDLKLTDWPDPRDETQMAFLSQLLQWHIDDPVDEEERIKRSRLLSMARKSKPFH